MPTQLLLLFLAAFGAGGGTMGLAEDPQDMRGVCAAPPPAIRGAERLPGGANLRCGTDLGGGTVTKLQQALLDEGHSPGPIDGVVGSQTLAAMNHYQHAKGLPVGPITLATLDALGVHPSSR